MTIKIAFFALFALLSVLSIIMLAHNTQRNFSQVDDFSYLKLRVSTPKQEYLLGETVHLNFEIVNEGSKKVVIPGSSTFEAGYLSIHIASGDKQFKDYFGSSRWQIDARYKEILLEPGQSFGTSATVLWNVKPEISHLNEGAAKHIAKERIMSDYALPEAGVYSIKAILQLPGETRPTIESAPIQIVANEPIGENLEIWNIIKNDKEFAYFIQYGEFLTHKAEQKEKLLRSLDEIVEKYPYSFYTTRIKQNLERLRADKETKQKTKS